MHADEPHDLGAAAPEDVAPAGVASDVAPYATDADWPAVRALWFAVQDADDASRAVLLDDARVAPAVRTTVRDMLRAAERVGERFERPAMLSLGMLAHADTAAPSLVGRRLGAYTVTRRVGQGGMGAVYEAVRADNDFEQRVAIKTLWRGADSDVLLRRFRSERQILATLQHPNIAALVDGGATNEGMPWLAMEFVDGVPIDTYCDAHELALPARIDLFRQVCAAVQYAHSRLVIHRDLKPSNVLVTSDGTVKLLDFGVAKLLEDDSDGTLTAAGLSPFTAAYAAPEQAAGGPIATSADVYALGALLVTLLAGEPPIRMDTLGPAARLDAVQHGAPRVPSAIARDAARGAEMARTRHFASVAQLASALHGELDAIAQMALRREPERRYQSAQSLADDLRRYLRRDRVLARPDTWSYRAWSITRRKPALVVGSAAVMLTIVLASVFSLYQARAMRAEAERSERVGAFLAGMAMGPNVATTDPVIRIGPQGTVAELLDSALVRVPTEFARDPRTRMRLYTAIGLNYEGQGRLKAARAVLDSAVVLSRGLFGESSPEYARALLEIAAIAELTDGPAVSGRLLDDIVHRFAGTSVDTGTVHASRLLLNAQVEYSRGNTHAADSLARAVRALELARGRATLTRARAEAVLTRASSWLVRDPRDYARRCRALIALTDSLSAPLSSEREFGAGCLSFALLVLGRTDEADSVLKQHMPALEQSFGRAPLFAANLMISRAGISVARGDLASRHSLVQDAWTLMEPLTDIPVASRLGIGTAVVEDAWSRNANDEAVSAARQMVRDIVPKGGALYSVFALLDLGLSEMRTNNWLAADSALRAGIEILPPSGDLNSMLPRLRRPLSAVLQKLGRAREADSVRALDPPLTAVPRCSPGGDWRGCD